MDSAEIERPKIEFGCTCGKKYRVPADRAGKRIKCKRCKVKLRVPEDTALSGRSRAAILAELGIDPDARPEKADEESARYHCTRCGSDIETDQLRSSYCENGLLCGPCRGVPAAAVAPEGNAEPPIESAKVAGLYLALFAVGFAGPLASFTPLGLVGGLAVALPIAVAGAALVYRLRQATVSVFVPRRKRAQENDTDGLPEGSKLY